MCKQSLFLLALAKRKSLKACMVTLIYLLTLTLCPRKELELELGNDDLESCFIHTIHLVMSD